MGIPANVSYPGIAQIQSATIRMGHGHTPDGFQLVLAPQPSNSPLEIGTLRLEYNNETLDFPDCRVDQASFSFDLSGNLIAMTILDRRWRWQFGRISGEYNIRREDGTIKTNPQAAPALAVENTERTPQQLAVLCLQAASEPIAPDAVAELPNDVRPYVNWDVDNPMASLAALAETLGCRIVLNPLDNLVRVRKVNVGAALPTENLMRFGSSADYFDSPDQIAVLMGYVRFQHDFELEAVGLDVDGNVKLIDDLSYAPADGWGSTDILSRFSSLDNEGPQNLAVRTVLRWYRVKVPFTLPVPNDLAQLLGPITSREQLSLLGSQVYKETIDGIKVARPAMVYGVWFRGEDAGPGNSATKMKYLPDDAVESLPADDARVAMIVNAGFSIDPETAVVKFSDVIWKKSDGVSAGGNELVEPATLRLRTSCYVRIPENGGVIRKQRFRTIRNTPQPVTLDLRHDEIRPTVYAIYNNDFVVQEVRDNSSEIDLEVEHYLDEAFERYSAVRIPQDGLYGGFVFNVPLDGAIQSITWSLGANSAEGPTTRIERLHDSGGTSGIPYRLKREYQRTADANRRAALAEWRLKEEKALASAIKEK